MSEGKQLVKKSYYPTRIRPKLEMIRGWTRNGLSIAQIAMNLGVNESTLNKYRNKYQELDDAIQEGREDAEIMVENALFKRACGYTYAEETKERVKVYDEDGEWTGKYEMITVKSVRKHSEGNVEAQKYWLEHRAPSRWERNPTVGVDVNAVNVQIQGLAELIANPVEEREIGSED